MFKAILITAAVLIAGNAAAQDYASAPRYSYCIQALSVVANSYQQELNRDPSSPNAAEYAKVVQFYNYYANRFRTLLLPMVSSLNIDTLAAVTVARSQGARDGAAIFQSTNNQFIIDRIQNSCLASNSLPY